MYIVQGWYARFFNKYYKMDTQLTRQIALPAKTVMFLHQVPVDLGKPVLCVYAYALVCW